MIGDEDFESDSDNFECQALPEEYDAQNDAGIFVRRHITETLPNHKHMFIQRSYKSQPVKC